MMDGDDQIDDEVDEEIEENNSLGNEKFEAIVEDEMQQEQNQALSCSICFDLQHPG